MPTYRIIAEESYEVEYEVDAADATEAAQLFEAGELDDGRQVTGGVESYTVQTITSRSR